MIEYSTEPAQEIVPPHGKPIASFHQEQSVDNIDWTTVKSFGEEWTTFNFFTEEEIQQIGDDYFDIASEEVLHKDCIALDVGCGSGRWSRYVCERVKFVEAVDPSDAVFTAINLLKDRDNVRVTQAASESLPFPDNSFDFVFSLGVLHHIPDTPKAMKDCVSKLKSGGHFLVYLYYSFDNKGIVFKAIFLPVHLIRLFVCRLPGGLKRFACDLLAISIYYPMVLLTKIVNGVFPRKKYHEKIPLWYYHDKTWNVIRNDSLDRFGTPLEQRFSQEEVRQMMEGAGLTDIVFSNKEPFWHAIGKKK